MITASGIKKCTPEEQGGPEWRQLRSRDPPQAELSGFEVGDEKKRTVADHRRHEGGLDDFDVGKVAVLGDDEGRGAHDRRHELPVGGGGHLHRGRLGPRVAHRFHQRDGEGAGGHHVGHRGAGDHAAQAGGDGGGLGRPAAVGAEEAVGHLDEVPPAAGLVHQRAEEHEHENDDRGDVERDPVDAFGGHGLLADETAE
jgi:hypothetical protein